MIHLCPTELSLLAMLGVACRQVQPQGPRDDSGRGVEADP